jgi:iron complex transport system substrate-binding protein
LEIRAAPSRRAVIASLAGGAAFLAAPPMSARSAGVGGDRVVSLGGGVTEILYALGCGERIVAVDLTSTYPAEARAKPNVGYYRRISAEGVLALSPNVIIAADGAGPKEALDVLAAASVRLVALDEVRGADDIASRIRQVAEAVGEPGRGAEVAAAVAADLAELKRSVGRVSRRRRALLLLGGGQGGSLTAAGADSTGALALELIGADNAAAGMSGWKPLSDEAALGFASEAVVALAAGAPITAEAVARHPALAASPAVREGRVVVADTLGLVGFGPRAAHVALDVARRVYPEISFDDLPARAWTAGAPVRP